MVYGSRTHRDVKIMHDDKLRPCISRQLPKWIQDHKAQSSDPCVPESSPTKSDPKMMPTAKKGSKSRNDQDGDAHARYTQSYWGFQTQINDEQEATVTRGDKRFAKSSYRYCLCKSARPAGLMVQCDTCIGTIFTQVCA